MSDIVERLRKQIAATHIEGSETAALLTDAADEIERLNGIRERDGRYLAAARIHLVDDERCCSECQGSGVKTYATSGTWRSGSGGMTLTTDVCDRCWGSGDAHRPWPSHREIATLRASLATARHDALVDAEHIACSHETGSEAAEAIAALRRAEAEKAPPAEAGGE